MKTRLIWITPGAEKLVGYIARVSNPDNQDNPTIQFLLNYCINHRHWSPFEMASACFEIETSRAIAAQILRHRSFSFQEFSQRYADPTQLGIEPIEIRKQSEKNRQSSTDIFNPPIPVNDTEYDLASTLIDLSLKRAEITYKVLLEAGVAKESARMVLPLATSTRLYMSGTLRSWVHYLDLRCAEDVQKEHRDIAWQIRNTLSGELPIISSALGWQQP